MEKLSPRSKARVAGVLYALEGTASVFDIYFRGRFIASGNAAATVANILANETLFRMVGAVALLAVAFHLAYTVVFYDLFRPVDRSVSLLAAFVSVAACTLQAVAALFQLAALLVVSGGRSVSGFAPAQVHALALLFHDTNGQAYDIYLIFFGLWLLPTGYLITRSTFMPRIIGVMLMLDGLGWATYLWPPLASYLYPVIAVVAALAEFPLLLWLLVVGVNAQRWREQASAASAPIGA